MYKKLIYPDLNKLKNYLKPNITHDTVDSAKNGIKVDAAIFNQEFYWQVAYEFEKIAEKHNLKDHCDELTFLIITFNDQLFEFMELIQENYDDDIKAKEIANFLLAIKTAKPENDFFRISIKNDLFTATIKDKAVSKWMAQLIYTAIESGDYPFDELGYKLGYNLFEGDLPGKNPIKEETLRRVTTMSLKSPKVRVNMHLLEFCESLQSYLHKFTDFPKAQKLSFAEADLFYDIFRLLGLVASQKDRKSGRDRIYKIFSLKSGSEEE